VYYSVYQSLTLHNCTSQVAAKPIYPGHVALPSPG